MIKLYKMKLKHLLLVLLLVPFKLSVLSQVGSLDPTFNTADINNNLMGANNLVLALAQFPDGKLLVGGQFSRFNNQPALGIVKLNADGSIDNTFNTGTGISSDGLTVNTSINDFAIQPDGKIIVVGQFQTFNGQSYPRIVRLNSDGSIDTSFIVGAGFNTSAFEVELQSNGQIIVAGYFGYYNLQASGHIARLNTNGSFDATFNAGMGNTSEANDYIHELKVVANDKILIGGFFNTYNGISTPKIARLNANGSLDTTFNVGTGANSWVYTIAPLADGDLLVSGSFSSFNGQTVEPTIVLNNDGSMDQAFSIDPSVTYSSTYAAHELPDGRLILGGSFTTDFGNRNLLVVSPDGMLDSSISFGTGPSASVERLLLTLDDQLLIGGGFLLFDGVAKHRLAKVILCQPQNWVQDLDGDGFAGNSIVSCYAPGSSWTNLALPLGDCNDNNPNLNPLETEICSTLLDEDCDGQVDETECNLMGYVFVGVDNNANGVYDLGDHPLSNYPVHVPGLGFTVFTNSMGYALVEYNLANTAVEVNGNNNFMNGSPASLNFSTNQTGGSLQFLMVPISSNSIYVVNNYFGVWGNRIHCTNGLDAGIFINNQGGQNLFASLVLASEALISPVASSNASTVSPSNTGIGYAEWIDVPIASGNSSSLAFHIVGPGAQALNQMITIAYTLVITNASGDIVYESYTSNDHAVVCAFDPNDLMGEPIGYGLPHYVPAGQRMEYRARFQNTGNIPAEDVRLDGYLDPQIFDLGSFHVLYASHEFEALLSDNGDFSIFFNDIMLVDSITDEPNSHGFAVYEVSLREDLAPLTEVQQSIGIVFDANEPIVTNVVSHTVYDCSLMEAPSILSPLCEYGLSTFSAEQNFVETYSWSLNGQAVGSESSLILELPTGDYSLSVTLTNPICSSTFDIPFVIGPFPWIDVETLVDLCEGEEYVANASCDGCELTWSGGVINGQPIENLLLNIYNYYMVTAIDQAGCENFAEVNIFVHPTPTVGIINFTGGGGGGSSDVITYDGSIEPFYTWQWFFNGVAIPGATTPYFNITQTGTGSYTLQLTDNYGCTGISPPFEGFVNVNEINVMDISLYPNPANDQITLSVPIQLKGETIRIVDSLGKLQKTSLMNDTKNIIDISHLAPGYYILELGEIKQTLIKQ